MFKVSNIERPPVNATAPAADVADTFLWRDYPQVPGVQISTDEVNFDWVDFRSAERRLRVRYYVGTGRVSVENCDPRIQLRHYLEVVNALSLYRRGASILGMATSIAAGIPLEIRERLDAEAAEPKK